MSHQETSHMFMNAWDADLRPPRGQAQFLSHLCKLQASVHEGREEMVTSTIAAGKEEEKNFVKHFRATLLCIFFFYPKMIILVFSQLKRSRIEKRCCSCCPSLILFSINEALFG